MRYPKTVWHLALAVVAFVLVWGALVWGFYRIACQPLRAHPDPTLVAHERQLRQAAWAFWGVLTTLTGLAGVVFYRAQRTQQALRQAEELYRRLANISADLILALRPDGVVQFVSPKVVAYGYKPEDVVGKPAEEFVLPEYREAFRERMAALRRGEAVPAHPFAVRTSDGSVAYGECRCFGVYDERGRLQVVWCAFHDLTDLLQLNRALQEQANALAQANADWALTFDAIGSGIAVVDETFTIVRANLALAELTGQPRDALIGRKCWEVLHPNAVGDGCPFADALRNGTSVSHEVTLPDGRVWLVRAYPSLQDGVLRRAVHIVRDVTQERQVQQLLERTQRLVTLGQMAAGVAHEINNPLSAIVGMAELLMDSGSDATVRQLAASIHEQALRIGQITRGLLAFARPRPQELAPVDLNGLVRQVAGWVASKGAAQGIAVRLQLREPLPPVLGDPTQLQQVVLHLLTNACEAMAERGGTLTVTTDTDGQTVRLTVDDTGPGIPAEHLPHLFDPFFTTKPVGSGTGLGLAIVHGIVVGHGGQVRAENRPGGGARFVVELPAFVAERREQGDRAAPSERPPLRLLVVGGEVPSTATLQALLAQDGHQVTAVPDAAAAIALLERHDYDLILCDLPLREGGGDLYAWLQRHKPHLTDRFVAVTGEFLPPTQRTASDRRVRVLPKPFRLDELRAVLQTVTPLPQERGQTALK